MRELERFVILQVVDQRWREHLDAMDYLREGVHLRAMAQKDPARRVPSTKGTSCSRSSAPQIREEVVLTLFHAQLAPEEADGLPAGAAGGRRERRRPAVRSTSPWPARRRSRPRAAAQAGATATLAMSRRRHDVDRRSAAPDREVRAGEHRPQRPVLVRQRQEVQEVPRRLAARSPREVRPGFARAMMTSRGCSLLTDERLRRMPAEPPSAADVRPWSSPVEPDEEHVPRVRPLVHSSPLGPCLGTVPGQVPLGRGPELSRPDMDFVPKV